jgi:uncharacterized protein with PQ loop repeat
MVSLASHILDTKAGHFDPGKFKDEFELALRKLVKRKAAGKTIEAPAEKEDRSNVIDLMEALRQSVKGKRTRAAALRAATGSRKTAKPKPRPKRRKRKAASRVPWLETAIGAAAAFCTTVSYLPQPRKCWPHRRDRDLSLTMLLLAAGLTLWLVYGTLRGDAAIIIANGISLVLLGGIIYFKTRSRRHEDQAPGGCHSKTVP